MGLGAIVRQQRERLGMTQDVLAAKAGISKPYLSNIETGRAKNPPSDTKVVALEVALGDAQDRHRRDAFAKEPGQGAIEGGGVAAGHRPGRIVERQRRTVADAGFGVLQARPPAGADIKRQFLDLAPGQSNTSSRNGVSSQEIAEYQHYVGNIRPGGV